MQYKTAAGACLLFLLLIGGAVSAEGIRGANSFLFSFGEAAFEQKGTRQETASACNYSPAQGNVLKIVGVKAVPDEIRAGSASRIEISYLVLSPAETDSRVTANLSIRWERELIGRAVIDRTAANGTYVIVIPLYFYPKTYNVRYGGYDIGVELKSGGLKDRGKTVLNVNEI